MSGLKGNSKCILALLLSACFGLVGFSTPMSAEETVPAVQTIAGGESYHGYVEFPGEEPESIYDGVLSVVQSGNIPAAYDSREKGYVTSVKNQNPFGTCWSFSAMAALESSLITQGIATDVDLSEYHLVTYSFQGVADPLGGTANDKITYTDTINMALASGGNVTMAYRVLANWVGAVHEEDAPYPTSSSEIEELPLTVESAYLNDKVHLQQAYVLNKSDTAAVKRAIMDYGAVTASFWYDAGYMNGDAYYTTSTTYSNHGVTIVGWDDNYSKSNFGTTPNADGAWLVKNSWGIGFGNGGYCWLSYEDTSLQLAMCVLIGETADNYDNNYQLDGSYYNAVYKFTEAVIANVFQAQDGEYGEALEAVAFEIGSANVNYSIQIYTDLKEEANPTSGTVRLAQPITGTATFQGYHTIKLPQSVWLEPNQTFAVVISLDKNGSEFSVPIECSAVWNGITFTAGAEANQSLLQYDGHSYWWDAGKAENANLRIKAFTTNITAEEAVAVIVCEASQMLVGDNMQLQLSINGETQPVSVNSQYDWSVVPEGIVEVSEDGMVTGLGVGEATVVCTHKENPAQTASVKLEIEIPFTDIRLTDWQYPYVVYVYRNNLMSGKAVNRFDMNGMLTRAEFVTVLYSYSGKPEVTYRQEFRDVTGTAWYASAVTWAKQNNVAAGYADGRFGVSDNITREQLVVMLYGYAGAAGIVDTEIRADLSSYSDVEEVSSWAEEAFAWAVQNNIVSGKVNVADNTPILDPKGNATRGECATIMKGFVESVK